MKIVCQRRPTVKDTTFGDLSIDGEWFCYTLEDPVRPHKIHGITAIPPHEGCRPEVYRVTLETSPRFGPETITLHGVNGYTGVRVHGGNDDENTEGCPLVGDEIIEDPDGDGGDIKPGTSQPALKRLKARIKEALGRFDNVTWEVRNAEPA